MPKKKISKEKKFIIRKCPRCKSDDVGLVLGKKNEEWECRKCNYRSLTFNEEELGEEEFLKYLDEKDAKEQKNK